MENIQANSSKLPMTSSCQIDYCGLIANVRSRYPLTGLLPTSDVRRCMVDPDAALVDDYICFIRIKIQPVRLGNVELLLRSLFYSDVT